jgi:OOP family OmpA-OmpF porin
MHAGDETSSERADASAQTAAQGGATGGSVSGADSTAAAGDDSAADGDGSTAAGADSAEAGTDSAEAGTGSAETGAGSAETGAGSAETGAGAAQAEGSGIDASAATANTGASDNAAGTSAAGATGESSSATGGGQADAARAEEPLVVGVVEAPGKKATRNEEVIPLTLGGLLPMTLGVDGQGEFDFDRAVLRQQVKELLDVLVSRLKESEYDRIEIVGHTDRIGAEDYNQYLSERRAWAVARYLVKQGVPVSKMRVEGRGMQEPVTQVHECDTADIGRDQLIACLQKDRRVVISASIRKVDVKVQ